ncbi:CHRD domain-containing protein [Flavobacterium sp.]|uniref:CHRD domain-containing protein n=1 Tax=Flavobacterium sp. TaxID=239 RepID=UPI002CF94088|nr:CHRD domain-containing protein [Flavobacterium sp.]HSD06217.1 CHRD domain-containing protein [Flavobacterium sp.]
MKRLLIIPAMFFLVLITPSCSNDDNEDTNPPTDVITVFNATLSAATGVTSSASGTAVLKLNQTKKTFEITVTYTGLTPTHGHIHGADGAVVIPFPDATIATSPFTVTGTITDAQILELMANHYYVNLHTTSNPGGEISGILMKGSTTGTGGGGGGPY